MEFMAISVISKQSIYMIAICIKMQWCFTLECPMHYSATFLSSERVVGTHAYYSVLGMFEVFLGSLEEGHGQWQEGPGTQEQVWKVRARLGLEGPGVQA